MADAAPIVTVVTAAYNAARWIDATLESVLAQTYRWFEYVVVDDGSTDDTPQHLARFGDAVRVLRIPNSGAAAARNAGIRAARGQYIAFLDHDDLWEPDKLEQQMALHEADPALAWSYTDAAVFDPDTGETLHLASEKSIPRTGDVLEALLFVDFIPFPSAVVRRDVFDRFGLLDERPERRHIDDWDFWLRIAGSYRVGYVAAPLLRYRWHPVQATQRMSLEVSLRNRLALIDEAVERHPHRLKPLRARAHAAVFVAVGRLYLSRGDAQEARTLFARALRHDATYRPAWIFLAAASVPSSLRRLLRSLTPRT